MIVLSAFAAAVDVIYIAASGDGSHGVTFAVIPAAAVMFALRGAWYSCRAYADSFLALHHAKDSYAVTPWRRLCRWPSARSRWRWLCRSARRI